MNMDALQRLKKQTANEYKTVQLFAGRLPVEPVQPVQIRMEYDFLSLALENKLVFIIPGVNYET